MIKKILITGSSGFIGGTLISNLEKNSFKIFKLSLNNENKTNFQTFIKNISQIDILIHLGENPNRTEVNKLGEKYLNEKTTILEKLLEYNYKQIIYLSSCLVYGENNTTLSKETDPVYFDDIYLKTKILCEKMVLKYNGLVLRCSNVYGIGMSKNNLISNILDQDLLNDKVIVNNLGPIRDYLHISDLIVVLKKLLNLKVSGIYNIGTGIGTSVEEIVKIILQYKNENGYEGIHERNNSLNILNINKISKLLSWKPLVKIDKGIKEIISNIE